MDAFRYRAGYDRGGRMRLARRPLRRRAVRRGRIPLDDIFLMATPLHSQNFVLVGDGHPDQQPPAGDQEHVVQRHRAHAEGAARDLARLRAQFSCNNARGEEILEDLIDFCRITPRYPDSESGKTYVEGPAVKITTDMERNEIISYLDSQRDVLPVADLAFYAYRDLARTDWEPFVKAAMERNPVCIEASRKWDAARVIEHIARLENESIYDGSRLAQPDEVWNFERGDGLEKALCLANIWKVRRPEATVTLKADGQRVYLTLDEQEVVFETTKGLSTELAL
jgi:hypothetical protein